MSSAARRKKDGRRKESSARADTSSIPPQADIYFGGDKLWLSVVEESQGDVFIRSVKREEEALES